jgi:hypothetical protein
MNRPLRSNELTQKSLDFIYYHGRNTLDAFAEKHTKKFLIEHEWIRDTIENSEGDYL